MTPVQMFLGNAPVEELGCGQNFTVGRHGNNNVIGFGDNKFGQLGSHHGVTKCLNPVPVLTQVSSLSCGWTHIVGLTSSFGRVVTQGRNTYGQLGRSSDIKSSVVIEGVTSVSSGYEHVLAVTECEELLVWGWNEHGNCGLNGTANVTHPRKLSFPGGQRVVKCFGGSGHSFCITSKNEDL